MKERVDELHRHSQEEGSNLRLYYLSKAHAFIVNQFVTAKINFPRRLFQKISREEITY
jgi:hypothetical protein